MATDKKQDLLFRVGHRDRLRNRFLADKLDDDEMLELLLADVIPRRDVRPLARGLIRHFGGLSQVLSASYEDLVAYNGIGHNTAVHIKLINQIMIQGYRARMRDNRIFHDTELLMNYCTTVVANKNIEEFHVIYLDKIYRLLGDVVHGIGTVDEAPVYEREVIKTALNLNASYVVLFHNHPTGAGNFSTDDILSTEKLATMLGAFGIELFDHIIVAGGVAYSARNAQLLNKSATSQTTASGS